MRTLGEIVEITLSGGQPEYDELRYALCAMQALLSFDMNALASLATAEEEGKKPFLIGSAIFQHRESFNRKKGAMEKSPKEYLGWGNDPKNPDYQESRKFAKLIFANAANIADCMEDIASTECNSSTI